MWQKVGQCEDWRCGERLWHAGLSEDGTKCFIAECEDNAYIVWDIARSAVIWKDDGIDGKSDFERLEDWKNDEGWIEIGNGPAEGRYRLFGLEHNYAKTESDLLGQRLDVRVKDEKVIVREINSGAVICELHYEVLSRDWAVASFSDDDATIAVIEPYYVTFFRQ